MTGNKEYKIVAFDLDGTLTDPVRGLTSAFRYAFRKMGIDYKDEAVLKTFIGPPIRELWQQMYGISREEAERCVDYFREYYSVYGWWDNEIYDGIYELLSELKASGKKIILATSKPDVHSSKILDKFDLSKFFDFKLGASFDGSREKKRDVLKYALDSIGVSDGELCECVLVGDTAYDAVGAREIGIDCIGVLWGYGSEADLTENGAKYTVKTVAELRRLLL